MAFEPILIDGQWRQAQQAGTLRAVNPANGERLPAEFPISSWADCDAALDGGFAVAATKLAALPPNTVADFLGTLRRAAGDPCRGDLCAGEPGDGLAGEAAAGRGRDAADDQSASAGRGRGARRHLAAGDDRHGEQHSLVLLGDRSGGRVRAKQLSAGVQWHFRAAILPRRSPPAIRSSPKRIRRIRARRSSWPSKRTRPRSRSGLPAGTVQLLYKMNRVGRRAAGE